MIYGYLRTSTKKQRIDRQLNGLKGLCDQLFIEKLSAASVKNRPIFNQIMSLLKHGDTFLIWDLDRAFRNTQDAIHHAKLFKERGVIFKAADTEIDISTGDKYYNYVSCAAAAERDRMKISERTIEGLEAARARGVRLGRPPKMTDRQIRTAKAMIKAGVASIADIATLHHVTPWTVTRAIRRIDAM